MAPTQADHLLKRIQMFTGLCVALSFIGGPAMGVLTFKISADYRIKALEESLAEQGTAVKTLSEERVAIARALARLESQVTNIGLKIDRVENILDRDKYSKGIK